MKYKLWATIGGQFLLATDRGMAAAANEFDLGLYWEVSAEELEALSESAKRLIVARKPRKGCPREYNFL